MRPGPPLSLRPRSCDRCGSCLSACPRDALKVGRTYLKVDWTRCDGCGACARVCAPRALTLRDGSARSDRAQSRPVVRRTAGGTARGAATQTPRSRSASEKAAEGQTPRRASSGPAVAKSHPLAALRSLGTPARQGAGTRGGFQWTLLEAAAMLSVTFSAFTLKEVLPLLPVMKSLPAATGPTLRVAALAVYYAIQIVVLVWLVRRRGGEPARALGLAPTGAGMRHWLTSAGLVMATFLATRVVASVYALITSGLGLMPSPAEDLPTLFGHSSAGFALAVIMVVVVGPFVEEAVFRAALLEGLVARLGAWPAIIIQAALFAAFHRSLWSFLPTFVLGVALGWLAHERDSLWPAIAVHALYNGLTVAAVFLVSGFGG